MDKKELYDKAKDAYYNGEEIMSDLEFDELEKELGLENKGYVGTHHQKSYTDILKFRQKMNQAKIYVSLV